jgi:hypothetical protein
MRTRTCSNCGRFYEHKSLSSDSYGHIGLETFCSPKCYREWYDYENKPKPYEPPNFGQKVFAFMVWSVIIIFILIILIGNSMS